MRRRKYLAAVGSIAAGGAAMMGTGATDVIRADRNVTVGLSGDGSARLSLEPTSPYATDPSGSGLTVDLQRANEFAITYVHELFQIRNTTGNGVEIRLNGYGANDENESGGLLDDVQVPDEDLLTDLFGDNDDGITNGEIDSYDPGSSTKVNPGRNGAGNFSGVFVWLNPFTAPSGGGGTETDNPYDADGSADQWDSPGEADLPAGETIDVSLLVGAAEGEEGSVSGEIQITADKLGGDYS